MTFHDRVQVVAKKGFTHRQARFLVTVMLHAGVCVPRQYARFCGIVHGQKTRTFFAKLVGLGYTSMYDCRHNRARIYHLNQRALYAAIGEADSRLRKPVTLNHAIQRLMVLDAIVEDPDLVWLGTAGEKAAHLTALTRIDAANLPHVSVGDGDARSTRYFAERLPIGIHLAALNARIAELLTDLNDRPMKGYGGASRRALFERFDRPALQPLPRDRYVHADWRHARVNIDYHVEVDRHYYSVPHALIHAAVEICLTATTVDVLLRGVRVWLHVRSDVPGRHTTIPEHMPKAHRAHLEWSPSRLIGWGATIGRHTEALVQALLESRPHPEQGYRSCLGILRLAKQHGPARLDAACARALAAGARSYRHVESILKHGLDRLPLDSEPAPPSARPLHANVRGPAYYEQSDTEGDRPC